MNRRSFLKACGVGVVAPSLVALGGATVVPEVEMVEVLFLPDNPFPEYYAPVKKLTLAETKKLYHKFRDAHANTTFRKPLSHA